LKNRIVIRNADIVNENHHFKGDIAIENSLISEIKEGSISGLFDQEYDASGLTASWND
jgi:dihydroorotase-like cyclic amidohydrolase